jgi:hypothetical protein
MHNMSNSMENNKAVKMLKAAEEGGYGVVGIVSVSSPLLMHFSSEFSKD